MLLCKWVLNFTKTDELNIQFRYLFYLALESFFKFSIDSWQRFVYMYIMWPTGFWLATLECAVESKRLQKVQHVLNSSVLASSFCAGKVSIKNLVYGLTFQTGHFVNVKKKKKKYGLEEVLCNELCIITFYWVNQEWNTDTYFFLIFKVRLFLNLLHLWKIYIKHICM